MSAQQATCMTLAGLDPMPEEVLCWTFSLPLPGLTGTECFRILQTKAAEALQLRYGDLEKVLNTEALLSTFTRLPFTAVLALLQHEGTCVGAEGTVCLAVSTWLDARPDGEVSREQLRELAAEVRFAGMPPGYMYHNLPGCTWLTVDAMKPQELLRVASYFQLLSEQKQEIKWGEDTSEQQMKAWVERGPRPMSSYTPSVELEVSMQQLQAGFGSAAGFAQRKLKSGVV